MKIEGKKKICMQSFPGMFQEINKTFTRELELVHKDLKPEEAALIYAAHEQTHR